MSSTRLAPPRGRKAMNRIVRAFVVVVAAGVGLARADVKVQEKSQLKFEGAMGTLQRMMGKSDASPTTVAVRGDRKLTLGESSAEIIDLKEERIYQLDRGVQGDEIGPHRTLGDG